MIQIACNWSRALSTLLANGQTGVDYIKMGAYGEFEKQFTHVRALKPIMLHGLGHFEHTGMKDIGIVNFKRANILLAQCGSPHYGLHLAITNADMASPMTDEEIHAHMSRQIQAFKKNIAVPLLLENTPDSPQERTTFDLYPYVEAEEISRLLWENNVGLLLDISHAKVAAQYREWNIVDYLSALPLDRLKEIHVNGPGYDEHGFPADTHQSMGAADYELLDWVISHSKPDVVTLEYVGLETENEETVCDNLRHQLTELHRICRIGK